MVSNKWNGLCNTNLEKSKTMTHSLSTKNSTAEMQAPGCRCAHYIIPAVIPLVLEFCLIQTIQTKWNWLQMNHGDAPAWYLHDHGTNKKQRSLKVTSSAMQFHGKKRLSKFLVLKDTASMKWILSETKIPTFGIIVSDFMLFLSS